jgi:hypothetical protein
MQFSSLKRNLLISGLVATLLAVSGVWGQTGTTSLRGTVTDKTGAAIVGAKVSLANQGSGLQRETSSGPSGEFEFLALPPGTYALTVEKQGFRKFEAANLQLLVNSPTTESVALQVGSTTETVEVTSEVEKLNTTDASLGSAFSENQIKELPIDSRNVPELLSLQAGVAYVGNRQSLQMQDTDTRGGAVNGAHSDQSNLTLDGVDVNTDTKGYAFQSVLPITQDSIQEFRVTTSNYNADEGRSSGAQVALVTKSGTNGFHGAVYEYNRNALTSANDYFNKLAQLQSGAPNKPEALVRNNFGGALGGPIKKDRLFFFMNYEGERQSDQKSVVRIVPSAAMRDGIITYQCNDPTQCPGGPVQGLTATHNIPAGYFGLTPAQIKGMDPQGIGVSQNVMIPYFSAFPLPNDNSIGDGFNFQGYRFAAPNLITNNWYIARVDYKITSNGNHSLYWRGALRNDSNLGGGGPPYLPLTSQYWPSGPEQSFVDYSKGFAVGYSAVLRSNLVNNFRWGFTRQSFGEVGNQSQAYVQFRGINDGTGTIGCCGAEEFQPTLTFQVPVHNFVDDVSWVKGHHTLSFGTNVNILRNPQSSNINSFNQAVTNASYFIPSGLGNQGVPGFFDPYCSQTAVPTTGGCFDGSTPSPAEPHYPKVAGSFVNNYDYPMIALVGMIDNVTANYNFLKNGSTVPEGEAVKRRFAADAYELYAQDSWKVKSNLTLTYGLRYSLFSPPWETNGLQVTPNVNLTDWFNQRWVNSKQGIGSNASPLLSFNLGGPANGRPGFYNWDYKDLAPRLSIAYSPGAKDGLFGHLFGGPGKTTIRAGAGIVYDRLGPALLATFDQSGSFGLASGLSSAAGVVSPATAPRIAGLFDIPTQGRDGTQLLAPPPVSTFPQTFPAAGTGSFAVYWGMDQGLKTPYSYTLDFSVGRDLGNGFVMDVSYVGRLSHRLLSQEDVATPEDIVDPKTKVDYFTAVTALAKLYRGSNPPAATAVTPQMVGTANAQYWADILQPLQPGDAYSLICSGGSTTSSLQAAYDLFRCFSNNESTGVQLLDQGILKGTLTNSTGNPLYTYYGPGGPYAFMSPQFAALYAWRSMSAAAYNALQVNLRHNLSHGFQFAFNYTYSRSIDISSDANRIGAEGGLGGQIINAWDPKALRAVSDFDTPHQFNANWVWELPFGNGRLLGKGANKALDAVIGGWQLTGLARWTSGFPVSVTNGSEWPTNWQLSGNATRIGSVSTHGAVENPSGTVNIFGNDPIADPNGPAVAAFNSYRPDFPGEVGARNTLRGDGFAGLDLGLDKRWKMPWKESHSLQLRWEVFNVMNLRRFDVQSLSLSLTNQTSFGNYSALLTNPRTMQFALRYEF